MNKGDNDDDVSAISDEEVEKNKDLNDREVKEPQIINNINT
mgnify:CR=1 FL=1